MGGAPTLVTVLASLLAFALGLIGWGIRRLAKGQWLPESVHLRELAREKASAEGWRKAYFRLLDAHDKVASHVDELMAGTRAGTRILAALPLPEPPPDPPEGSDVAVAA